MKFLFAMLACLAMGLGILEVGNSTGVAAISQIGLGVVVVAVFGVFTDMVLDGFRMVRINVPRAGICDVR
ncbi:hypothetical protein [Pseudomonas sp. PLMAX]|uniref:hypothetical protein n=1 Tax=Pseudomonas sp. PLMAX TaxID=2201998 RepID=UPI0038BB984B